MFSETCFAQMEGSLISLSTPDPGSDKKFISTDCYPCLTGSFWTQAKKSVVRIITFREGETIMCTGTLVNNTAQDAKPYILTANHCLTNQDDVDRAVFTFNYEDANCEGIPLSNGSSMIGGKLRATSYAHDFTLVELDHHVPLAFHPYFSGWDVTQTSKSHVSCIHHPLGGLKEVSVDNDFIEGSSYTGEGAEPRAQGAFWRVKQWDLGTTEYGSSGAPLFDQQLRIVGTLSGGKSKCGLPYNDYFQKLSDSWMPTTSPDQQLKYWLDPVSSGVNVLEGLSPTDGKEIQCDTISNVAVNEATHSLQFSDSDGYLAGCNAHEVTALAEAFYTADSVVLTGIQLFLGVADPEAAGGIMISVKNEEDGAPGQSVAEKYVPYSQLKLYFNYIEFYPGIKVGTKFFVTFYPDCSGTNQFSIEQAHWRTSKHNTAWALRSDVWIPFTELNAQGFGSSLSVNAIVCKSHSAVSAADDVSILSVYPNPASSKLICTLNSDQFHPYRATVFNLRGQTENVHVDYYNRDFIVDVSYLDAGIYLLVINSAKAVHTKKFVKH